MGDVIRITGVDMDPDAAIRLMWAESLADHLDARGMSRKELRHRLETEHGIAVSMQAISFWLRGVAAPRPSVQVAIAEVLGVPARSLFPLRRAA